MIALLCVIATVASVATLGVVLLRPACRPIDYDALAQRMATAFAATPIVAATPHALPSTTPAASVTAARSERVFRKTDPRFYIQAVDTNGNETRESWRGDDEAEAKRLWRYFNEGQQKGTFTLWDRHHAGHRGQFSRGVV